MISVVDMTTTASFDLNSYLMLTPSYNSAAVSATISTDTCWDRLERALRDLREAVSA